MTLLRTVDQRIIDAVEPGYAVCTGAETRRLFSVLGVTYGVEVSTRLLASSLNYPRMLYVNLLSVANVKILCVFARFMYL